MPKYRNCENVNYEIVHARQKMESLNHKTEHPSSCAVMMCLRPEDKDTGLARHDCLWRKQVDEKKLISSLFQSLFETIMKSWDIQHFKRMYSASTKYFKGSTDCKLFDRPVTDDALGLKHFRRLITRTQSLEGLAPDQKPLWSVWNIGLNELFFWAVEKPLIPWLSLSCTSHWFSTTFFWPSSVRQRLSGTFVRSDPIIMSLCSSDNSRFPVSSGASAAHRQVRSTFSDKEWHRQHLERHRSSSWRTAWATPSESNTGFARSSSQGRIAW